MKFLIFCGGTLLWGEEKFIEASINSLRFSNLKLFVCIMRMALKGCFKLSKI